LISTPRPLGREVFCIPEIVLKLLGKIGNKINKKFKTPDQGGILKLRLGRLWISAKEDAQ
jgi:hypothetical protein